MLMANTETMYDEAIELQQKGDTDGAIARLKTLLESDPNHALAHAALSVFYSRQDQHDEAIDQAQKVCELEPEDPFSYVALSLVCQKAGMITEAEQAMMRARQAQYSVKEQQ